MKQPPDLPEPTAAVCPYCKQILDKRPERKKKCPHCHNYIYVRSKPSGDHHKVLVTENGAKRMDLDWQKVWWTNKWLRRLEQDGLSDRHFDRVRERLRERFGQEPSDADVVWALLNEAGDIFSMALFLYEEGRDFLQLLQRLRKMELMSYEGWGRPAQVEILAGGDSCESCKAQNGRILTVDQALKTMPLPNNTCSYELEPGKPGWCRCIYLPVFDS
jgi:hypothetical protein